MDWGLSVHQPILVTAQKLRLRFLTEIPAGGMSLAIAFTIYQSMMV
jgi:hypothetical protein